jgi:Ca-activated chloride channel family protein
MLVVSKNIGPQPGSGEVQKGIVMAIGNRQWLCVALITLSVFGSPLPAHVAGPEPRRKPKPPDLQKSAIIRMNVEMTLVNVSVTDPLNNSVTSLNKENFKLYEDGVEQEISAFSTEDVPISIGLIFDVSGSMGNKLDRARQAAIQFLRTANPHDEFFLVRFNDRAELTNPFTSSEELEKRIMFTAAGGRTALLDAVYLGLDQMRSAHNARRALLIISDGGDNHSLYNEADVRNSLREADCQLDAMGIFDRSHIGRKSEERYGWSLLSELVETTGGRVYPVSKVTDLPAIASKIGMELRNQYVLGYKPPDMHRSRAWRKIKVKLNAPRGLPPVKIYARSGYYAPID